MEIKPIRNYKTIKRSTLKILVIKAEVSEIGKVLSVGDGIARVYGLR